MTYKRTITVALALVIIAAVVTLANVSKVFTSPQGEEDPQVGPAVAPPAVSPGPAVMGVIHVLKATYINTCSPSCNPFTLPPNTSVGLDSPTTITCSAAIGKTCTITDTAWIQSQNTSSTGNNAGALQLVLDGTVVDYYLSGTSPANAFYYDGLYSKIAVVSGVSRGTHTVQTQARSVEGANGAAWAAKYEVYTP